MKESTISNCEKQFVLQSIKNNKRLDGRGFEDFRKLEIRFGSDYGCCYTTLGETKVLAQVSCYLTEPRQMRPTEGCLFINVEINETVCPSYDTGHQPHLATHANRLLEKCIKESNCIDLEALCINAAELVFDVRVDVTVLNYDGNLITCCSIATLSALAHFKLPAVTIEDSVITVHSVKDKDPTPLSLHHFPILISFAVFCDGEFTVVDPNELEEKVSEGELVIGMNNYRELCVVHFSGKAIGNKDLVLSCASKAALIVSGLVKRLKSELEMEKNERYKNRGESIGLADCVHLDRILSASRDRQALRLTPEQMQSLLQETMEVDNENNSPESAEGENQEDSAEGEKPKAKTKSFFKVDKQGGLIIKPMKVTGIDWVVTDNTDSSEESDSDSEEEDDETSSDEKNSKSSDEDGNSSDDVNYVKTITDEDRIIDRIELSEDSEEEEVLVLQ